MNAEKMGYWEDRGLRNKEMSKKFNFSTVIASVVSRSPENREGEAIYFKTL